VTFFSRLKAEIQRHWRGRYQDEMQRRNEPVSADFSVAEPDDGELHPPDARRVAARACCLSAVGLRGLASQWPHEEQQQFIPSFHRWFSESGLQQEIEDTELEILRAPADELDDRNAINACWRWEGAAVLAASLGRLSLPAHDETIDTKACGDACGLFADRGELDRLISNAALDAQFDRDAYANKALAIMWRLRQFAHIEQQPLDFADFARSVEWATFNLEGVALCERDLAIGGRPITDADPELLQLAMNIASERHVAANWLIGWNPIYSDLDNPT
jgi:hypothetical protein